MSTQVEDFWPAEIGKEAIVTPAAILREQATVLARRTNGLIEADVSTNTEYGGRINHRFDLVVPALDDYRYELFTITHPATLYPVSVNKENLELETEKEFKDWLKATLTSNNTRTLLSALLAQSRA